MKLYNNCTDREVVRVWMKLAPTASILSTSAHRHSCQRRAPEPKFALLSDSAEAVEAEQPPRILIEP